MRLLLVAAASSVHTWRWCTAFAERGHEVHLLTQHAEGAPYREGVRTHLLPHRSGLGYLLNRSVAARLARSLRPDAINAHYASGYGTLAPRLEGAPLILNVWGSDVYEFPETSALHRWLLRRNLMRADAVVSTSEVMAARTRAICPELDEISVVPFGVDARVFCPAPRRHADLVVGTVKALAPKYGIDTLVEAFALVIRRDGMDRVRLRIVGDGPSRGGIESLAARLGVRERVDFIGPVAHERVPEELQRLDVYVALSRAESESFGVAVIEASACGLPVVVSRVGGLPEVVEDGVTGIVVPKEDPTSAATAIAALLQDEAKRADMGAKGRGRVLGHYEWETCVDRQLAVIGSAIANFKRS